MKSGASSVVRRWSAMALLAAATSMVVVRRAMIVFKASLRSFWLRSLLHPATGVERPR
jgi:hypothetical protein